MLHDYGLDYDRRDDRALRICAEHDVDLARDSSCPSCAVDDVRTDSASARKCVADALEETLALAVVQCGDCVDDPDTSGNGDDATALHDARALMARTLDLLRGRTCRHADEHSVIVIGLRPVTA